MCESPCEYICSYEGAQIKDKMQDRERHVDSLSLQFLSRT